jgi:hypothetical protein
MSTNELHERIYAPYATAASSASASAGTRAPPTSCSPAAVPPRSSYAALLLAPSSSCSGWDPPTATPHWPMSSTPPATAPAQGGPSMSRPCAGYATPTTCPHPHPSRPAGLLWVSAQPQSTRRDRRDPLLGLGTQELPMGAGSRHQGLLRRNRACPPHGPAPGQDQGQASVRAGQGVPQSRGHDGRRRAGRGPHRHPARRDLVPAAGQHRAVGAG